MKWKEKIILIFLLFFIINYNAHATNTQENLSPKQKTDFEISHQGLKRKYRVYLPNSYNKNVATPVVIFFHGAGGNLGCASREGLEEYSDKLGFILVSPEGLKVKHTLFGNFWNGGKWKGGECCTNADDVGFISKMIDELQKNFNVDSKRIYATGISNGGLMTNRLACELANKIAAVAVVASMAVPEHNPPARPISVMIIYGREDPANPLDDSPPARMFANRKYERMRPQEVLASWLKINECSTKATHTDKTDSVSLTRYQGKDKAEVVFCIIEKMGHTWPGGKEALFSKAILGNVSHDFSMSDIWAFFQQHPMP